MRKVYFCLVLAACVWMFAPALRAGGGQSKGGFAQQQWRIFPHAPFRRAADQEIASRFTRQIEPLSTFFRPEQSSAEFESAANALLEEKARNQFFRLESLLRLYRHAFPDFEKYLAAVKEMEDGIGAYSFSVDSLKFAEDQFKKENQRAAASRDRLAEQEKIIEGLRKKKSTARIVFTKLVDRSTLSADLPALRSQLDSSLTGWPARRDLEYVNGELVRLLKDVKDTRYNFNELEDGIHEFRRQLRWFPMTIDSLDGLILLRDDPKGACPVPALESLAGTRAATHRYSNPPLSYPASHPCTISRCLLWPVVKSVDELGRLKDEAEGKAAVDAALNVDDDHVAWSNTVSPEAITRAKAIKAELMSSHALETLMGQLSSCKP
ncbi:MAG TPA: hypothetical protein VF456_03185 [Vicinamibacterales bacterium]